MYITIANIYIGKINIEFMEPHQVESNISAVQFDVPGWLRRHLMKLHN